MALWGGLLQLAVLDLIRKVGSPTSYTTTTQLCAKMFTAAGVAWAPCECGACNRWRAASSCREIRAAGRSICVCCWVQVCRQNPNEKGKYIKIIVSLLAVCSAFTLLAAFSFTPASNLPTAAHASVFGSCTRQIRFRCTA